MPGMQHTFISVAVQLGDMWTISPGGGHITINLGLISSHLDISQFRLGLAQSIKDIFCHLVWQKDARVLAAILSADPHHSQVDFPAQPHRRHHLCSACL